jgi:hypothetical protein
MAEDLPAGRRRRHRLNRQSVARTVIAKGDWPYCWARSAFTWSA